MMLSEDGEIRFDDLIYALRTVIRETREGLGDYKDWIPAEQQRVESLQGLDKWLMSHQMQGAKIAEWIGR